MQRRDTERERESKNNPRPPAKPMAFFFFMLFKYCRDINNVCFRL